MRIVIIGAVAAGTSAAAKARRNSEDAEIVIYEKDSYISYSGCGMPYYLGGEMERAEELTPRDPAFFKSKYRVDIFNQHEVIRINPNEKSIEVRNLTSDEVLIDHYDKLVIATGARAVIPPIVGVEGDNVFTLRSIKDMIRIKNYITQKQPKTVAIIGTGFIGLEVCENLKAIGLEVNLIERLPHVTPGLDHDMASYVKEELEKNGVTVHVGVLTTEIKGDRIFLSNGKQVDANMIIVSAGVMPNVELAK
ncbi:MAG TPA: FAD-dependent oxidoreductase, partial [Lachnospiraceae bacterium]|nr:FAD-dependent oxidoreductase [Lachnospiraceae bacterium]